MISKLKSRSPISTDLASLSLRLFFGLAMFFSHGLGKFNNAIQGETDFANVFGMGEPISLWLAVFAEFVCAGLIAIGLWTRFALIPLMITMAIAAFVIHWDDPFGKKEFALLYLVGYLAIFLLGAGKYSVDAKISKR